MLAAAATIATWDVPRLTEAPLLLTLIPLTIALQQWRLNLYRRGHSSPLVVVLACGSILLGPTVGACLGIVAGLAKWPWRTPRKYLFDAGMFALCGVVLAIFPWPATRLSLTTSAPELIACGFVVGAVAYLINMSQLVGVMSLDEWMSPLAVWRERFAWETPHHVIYGFMAVGMALAGKSLGALGLIIFAMPVFAMRMVTQQYIERTKTNVDQLRTANDALRFAHDELAEKHEALGRAYAATRTAFSGMLNARDNETEGHSERVVGYALAVGEELGLSPRELADLEVGALLHDIGKVGVPDAILHKQGPLTSEEWQEMRRHPEIGADLVGEIPFLRSALPVVRHHHERWDGSGYPDGLRGPMIPLAARIFSIADVYDALISDRPYRPALSPSVAVAEIERASGSQFDPAVVAAFLKLVHAGVFARPYLTPVEGLVGRQGLVTYRRRMTDWSEPSPLPRRAQAPTTGY